METIESKFIGKNKIVYNIENTLDPLLFYKYYSRGFNLKEIYCTLIITVNLKTYSNEKRFYDLSYNWTYSKNPLREDEINPAYNLHPFYNDKKFIVNHNDGEIIYKNSLTDKIVEFLLLPIDKLSLESGNVSPYQYQKSLLEMVTKLWD